MRWTVQQYAVELCRVCRGKRIYRTWADAERVARRQRHRTGVLVAPYWSKSCGCYHIGAVRKTKNKRGEALAEER